MRTQLIIVTLCALALSVAPISAQVVPSTYTPLGICMLYDSVTPLPANTTVYFFARGECGIPETANAVSTVTAALNPSGNGVLRLWDSGVIMPAIPSMYLRSVSGADSSELTVRLCYPFLECTEDLAVHATVAARITVSVNGYFEPLLDE